ncbi:BMC domain-containing protein [Desulfovibrio sp. OttesenSCG-928-G15]|nr:BMC domain-containing protein [Desulfovibrio sp. OttesenSCG-928-G15]
MDTLGLVELSSIAAGAGLADGMVKAATVELVRAAPLCGGRYHIQIAGDRQSVETSVNAARNSGRKLISAIVISGIAKQVIEALKRPQIATPGEALGVVEARNVSAGILAADQAVKRSNIILARFVAGTGIMGKSYFVLSGDVASVKEGMAAAEEALGEKLVETCLIARPDAAVFTALTGTR